MTPATCRAARALLDMGQEELAKAARVAKATIVAFETGKRVTTTANRRVMQQALEAAGVIFILSDPNGGPGVRLRGGPGA